MLKLSETFFILIVCFSDNASSSSTEYENSTNIKMKKAMEVKHSSYKEFSNPKLQTENSENFAEETAVMLFNKNTVTTRKTSY